MGEVTFDKKRRDGMDKDFQAQINRQFKALTDTRSYQVSVEGQVAEADLISVYFWRIIPEYLLSMSIFCPSAPFAENRTASSLISIAFMVGISLGVGKLWRTAPTGITTASTLRPFTGFLT